MLDLREIEAFRSAVTSGSLSAAGKLLNTSQPNITRLIANMEKKLGYPLFIRRSRGVTPTAEAEILFAEVNRSFHGLAEISRAAEEIGQYKNAQLSIGAVPAHLLELVPKAVAEWRRLYGELSITIELRESDRIIHWIRARRFDLGLVSPILDVRDVNIIARRELPYVMLAQPGGQFFGDRTGPVGLKELAGLPLILPGIPYFLAICRDPDLLSVLQRSARMDGFVSQTAAQLAMEGVGVAIVDPITAGYFQRRFGAIVRPMAHSPVYETALISPRHPVHARAAVQFGAMLDRALAAV